MADPVGPLVVAGRRWALPDGRRGVLAGPVAAEAAAMGAAVVIVVGDPTAHPLWAEGDAAVCTAGGDGARWRWRVELDGAAVVTLVLVDRDTGRRGGPWGPGLGALDVADALRVLQQLLGVPWGHSTSRTVEHLILSTHPVRKGGRRLDRDPQVPDVARGCERRYHWMRELAGWELAAPYVHTYDANAAYLGTIASLDLGFGRPVHYSTPRGCQAHIGWPGIWRVDCPADLGAEGGLPPIASGEWVSTPTLHRLSEFSEARGLGAVIPVEGWGYPERARWLSGAAGRLRDARTAAREEEARARVAIVAAESDAALTAAVGRYVTAGVVREAVKELYTVLPGRFASTAEYVTAGWRRPDWAAAIIGGFRSNLHRKLERLDTARPFAIGTDALAFAADDPDPVNFAATIGLRIGGGLGEFGVQGSAAAADVAGHLARGRGGVVGLFGAVKRGNPSPADVALA